MASLLLLLSVFLLHGAQALPVGLDGGRGLDVRFQLRDLQNRLSYEDQMMSYPGVQAGGGARGVFHQSEAWKTRGLEQALRRLLETDPRRDQEDQQAAYLAALLRLLNQVQRVEVLEEEDQSPPGDFQDYDETGRGTSMARPLSSWGGVGEPQLTQMLLDRMQPQLVQSLLQRQAGWVPAGPSRDQDALPDQDALSWLVSRLLSSVGPGGAPGMASGRRARRELPSRGAVVQRRARRSLEDEAPPLGGVAPPSSSPPLLRVKRLEEEPGRRRRRGAGLPPQVLLDQMVEYLRG
ncbi:proprotein convertase subtilisin/kexin type 1 inhibitor, like [Menidia menidia]